MECGLKRFFAIAEGQAMNADSMRQPKLKDSLRGKRQAAADNFRKVDLGKENHRVAGGIQRGREPFREIRGSPQFGGQRGKSGPGAGKLHSGAGEPRGFEKAMDFFVLHASLPKNDAGL